MWCIYKYENIINGHMYIGLTNNFKRRLSEHITSAYNPNYSDYDTRIHRAIRKYGIKNFNCSIIEDNIETLESAKERESYWIKEYNTFENEEHYNLTPGGDIPNANQVHIGEEHGMAILTEEEVRKCREFYKEGKRSREIYELYYKDRGISYSGFSAMWHGKTWKHIMPEVFKSNPHRAKYNSEDRDYIVEKYLASGLKTYSFSKSKECYVGYGTLWNMINNPSFYDDK